MKNGLCLANWQKVGGTLFIQRGSGDSIKIREQISSVFKHEDIPVLFFPEATTTDGSNVKKVHGRILGAAIEAQRDVQICLICYVNQQGGLDQVSPFIGNISFAEHVKKSTRDATSHGTFSCAPSHLYHRTYG